MSEKSKQDTEVGVSVDGDEAELARLGYKQTLKYVAFNIFLIGLLTQPILLLLFRRELSLVQASLLIPWARFRPHMLPCCSPRKLTCYLQNFGVSFSIISVITGVPSLFLYGLASFPPSRR